MGYVQANILLTAPYTTPSDVLFMRASNFQESLEAEPKTHYKTEDACRHPEYSKELLALLTLYYEGVLGMAGASGVTAPRALALYCTPKKPHKPADPRRTPPTSLPPHRRGQPAHRSPRRRRQGRGKGGVRGRGSGK